jgi:hypothetical protein
LRNLPNTQSGNIMSRTKTISRIPLVVFQVTLKRKSSTEMEIGTQSIRARPTWSLSDLLTSVQSSLRQGPLGAFEFDTNRNFSIPALTVTARSNCALQPQQRLHSQLWLVSGRRTRGSHHRNHGIIGEAGLLNIIY